jgi:predicted CopG family antitoxin
MKTISFSIEDEVAKDIAKIAKRENKSKSDVLREMYENYAKGRNFKAWLKTEQKRLQPTLKDLSIVTGKDLEDYLESDQTYEDRLRHQRLSPRR